MARPPRVNWEGAWYHVTDRGNERAAIFRDDEERSHLLEMLGRMSQRYQIRVHVYTWMDNHYHLIVETPEANLSAGMQWLNGGYGRWFNGRHGRQGHLWEGRFKAVVVEPERWGLELSRYVHLNPVRVKRFGLDKGTRERHRLGTGREAEEELWEARVTGLRNYPWSSYRSYIGLEKPPEWLHCETILSWMGRENGRRAYQEYVERALREGLKQAPWKELQARVVLGSVEFLHQVESRLDPVGGGAEPSKWRKGRPFEDIVGLVEQAKGERWDQFCNRYGDWGRNLVLTLAYDYGGMKLKELGALAGGLNPITVSGAIKRFKEDLQRSSELAEIFRHVRLQLENGKV